MRRSGTRWQWGELLQTGVIRAVESSLEPWSPRQLTIKSIGYRDGDGMPNGIIPELAYVCFDELWAR